MRPDEVVALGELAGDSVGGAVARIEDMHTSIAERVFNSVGAGAEPVRAVHDGVAKSVYAAVRVASSALLKTGATAVGAASDPDDVSLTDRPGGRLALGALNGAFGDRLVERGSPLTEQLTVRRGGRDLELNREALADVCPDASPRLALFLHGLCETDDAWRLRSARYVPYGDRLETELGYTSLYVNYNSGRHISDNGRELARALATLLDSWPVGIEEIAFVGHSMGGLVARSACHYGATSDWAQRVRHVFTLGCPHTGAPLERAANAAASALALLPETRGLAKALNLRSAGIKDLRYGYVIEEDWFGHDPDIYLRNTGREIPFLETANHYFVCATLSRDSDGPLSRLFGDWLVLSSSAWASGGRGQRLRFPVDNYRHYGGASHFDLLNHPAIYEQLRRWLTGRPALPAPEPVTSG
ncbi:MAG TPA: alpha/beta hydrolase [Solirubrobacteraceae bacterium]|jgi:pimeloyl-ACP methyl ester carboxylesterase|nr:alpha/beta hydrolase [Solirubrobacteraceae bacterium]